MNLGNPAEFQGVWPLEKKLTCQAIDAVSSGTHEMALETGLFRLPSCAGVSRVCFKIRTINLLSEFVGLAFNGVMVTGDNINVKNVQIPGGTLTSDGQPALTGPE